MILLYFPIKIWYFRSVWTTSHIYHQNSMHHKRSPFPPVFFRFWKPSFAMAFTVNRARHFQIYFSLEFWSFWIIQTLATFAITVYKTNSKVVLRLEKLTKSCFSTFVLTLATFSAWQWFWCSFAIMIEAFLRIGSAERSSSKKKLNSTGKKSKW